MELLETSSVKEICITLILCTLGYEYDVILDTNESLYFTLLQKKFYTFKMKRNKPGISSLLKESKKPPVLKMTF